MSTPQAPGEPRAAWKRWSEPAWVAAAALGAFLIALRCARMGYMPLDQSIGFDGGWRILSGQLPLRDYLAPNGYPMHALQALFFALFGVNWLALCLHAAAVNAVAAVLAHRWLRRFGVAPPIASGFALCTAVVFTPPFGTPYMDTHSFLFSLAALCAALCAALDDSARWRAWAAWSTGPLLALAYLSKQIPAVFFLPLCLAACAFAREARLATLRRMLASLAATGLLLVLSALALGVDPQLVDVYVRQLPSEEGVRRFGYVPGFASVLARFEETRAQLALATIPLVHVVGLPALLAGAWCARRASRTASWRWRPALGAAVLAELLLLACLGYIALTSNDKELGVPLVFLAAGLAASAVGCAATLLWPARRLATPIQLAVLALAAQDALRFHARVNETRKVNDLVFDEQLARASAPQLPPALGFLRWSAPKLVTYTPADLRALCEHLRAREGGMFLVGDASPLYGLTGKPSVSPALWYHPGLTFPLPYDPRFDDFEARLLERLERFGVRTVVVEPRVWVGYRAPEGETPKARLVGLDTFPRVAAWVNERRESERSIGAFRVIELR